MKGVISVDFDDGRHKNNTTADEFDRIFVDKNF